MIITLTKEDILKLVKQKFDVENAAIDEETGNIIINTELDTILNDKKKPEVNKYIPWAPSPFPKQNPLINPYMYTTKSGSINKAEAKK